MKTLLLNNGIIINDGKQFKGNILIEDGFIKKVSSDPITHFQEGTIQLNLENLIVIPGVIDDQVHFRQPGLTHKADIYHESRAAVAGGVTSFMEMPNTIPQTTTIEYLEEKFALAYEDSIANYSFYLGATNENINEIKKINPKNVCGLKVFMGSSTGNMLVDKKESLESIFIESPVIIATHCEDEETVRTNLELYKNIYGDDIPLKYHPVIRSEEACYKSSSLAVELATKFNSKLHILHISTEKELSLFDNKNKLKDKKITGEVCVHHLWFDDNDYERYGTRIKWNPAIKKSSDKNTLRQAVINNKLDVIATDHAPHTIDEKDNPYTKAPSGGPLVQHSLLMMLELWKQDQIELTKIVEKMCHNPSILFNIDKRGYIQEGFHADIAVVDPNETTFVTKKNLLYKCKWSPMEDFQFSSEIKFTIVNGEIVYDRGKIINKHASERLIFDR